MNRNFRPNQPGGGAGNREASPATLPLPADALKKIITGAPTEEESARLLVQSSDKLGKQFKEGDLTTSQIRNFFGEVKKIQLQGFANPANQRRFILMIPKLEYSAKRASKPGMTALKETLKAASKYVSGDEANFRRFVEFFEAILAYHKAYGGK